MKQNSPKAWLLASRPKTLTGAAMPVMVGLAFAAKAQGYHLDIIPAVLCMLFALIMQIDANFVNDYFDWRKGNDDEATRLGPLRACSQGWVTPKAMVIAILITTALAGCVGLPLIYYGGWRLIFVGIACVVFCVLYTTTLSYIAMGDVLVLVFFGIVPVCYTYFIQVGNIPLDVFLISIAVGSCVDTLLVVNNYRDIDNDRRDGKRTLVVLVGKEWGLALYMICSLIAAVIAFYVFWPAIGGAVTFLFLAIQKRTFKKMQQLQGRELNQVLGETARNIFIFGLLVSVGALL